MLQQSPDYRIILLGASNLTLGLPRLLESLWQALPGTIEFVSAHGHGRSYLKWSYVVYRGLPGIRDCDLWTELENRPPAKQTLALVTDLGCDLFYGSQPEPIIESVADCFEKLLQHQAKIVFARPPLQRLHHLPAWQYYIVKNVFFPGPTIPWPIMRESITEVDLSVSKIAGELSISSVAPECGWYGFDPIHILREKRNEAWQSILSEWQVAEDLKIQPPTLSRSLHLWRRKAAQHRIWRLERNQKQPVHHWSDGSSLSVF